MIKFHEVIEPMRKVEGDAILPTRATRKSGAYDFYAKTNYIAKPNEIVKIWTDVKAEMDDDVVLLIDVRSSMGGKWELINTIGVIDADYYNNPKNDGNIGVFLRNTSDEVQTINKGDRIAQGIFIRYLITVDDKPLNEKRNGGFGSTGK